MAKEWETFDEATKEIERALAVDADKAQSILWRLCADGEVEFIDKNASKIRFAEPRFAEPEWPPRPVPAQSRQPPTTATAMVFVLVSGTDLQDWIRKELSKVQSGGPQQISWAEFSALQGPQQPRPGRKQSEQGKQPRILKLLAEMFPDGPVPEPAYHPRKELKAEVLKRDPGLKPLDDATLKAAIDKHNAGQR